MHLWQISRPSKQGTGNGTPCLLEMSDLMSNPCKQACKQAGMSCPTWPCLEVSDLDPCKDNHFIQMHSAMKHPRLGCKGSWIALAPLWARVTHGVAEWYPKQRVSHLKRFLCWGHIPLRVYGSIFPQGVQPILHHHLNLHANDKIIIMQTKADCGLRRLMAMAERCAFRLVLAEWWLSLSCDNCCSSMQIMTVSRLDCLLPAESMSGTIPQRQVL